MEVDILNTLVSGAIWRAEQSDELGLETARSAWKEVSKLEEEIAKLMPVKDAEGRISRRGAVRAALRAEDPVRAQDLVKRYAAEDGAPRALGTDLRKMLKASANELSEQFPFATKYHKPNDVQMLANQLRKSGPFSLAEAV